MRNGQWFCILVNNKWFEYLDNLSDHFNVHSVLQLVVNDCLVSSKVFCLWIYLIPFLTQHPVFSLIRNWCWQIISWLRYPEASATSPTWLTWVWERTCCNTFPRRLVNTNFFLYMFGAWKILLYSSMLQTIAVSLSGGREPELITTVYELDSTSGRLVGIGKFSNLALKTQLWPLV